MEAVLFEKVYFLKNFIDAIPYPIFIVDQEFQVRAFNQKAFNFFNLSKELSIEKKPGEVLDCAFLSPNGCGNGDHCNSCIIRDVISKVIMSSDGSEEKLLLDFLKKDGAAPIYLLLTAGQFRHKGKNFAVLLIEDVSELMKHGDLLTMCVRCNKVLDQDNSWDHTEQFLKSHFKVDISHTVCPECWEKQYPLVKDMKDLTRKML